MNEQWSAPERSILNSIKSSGDVIRVLDFLPERRICVQAGGAIGAYAKRLSEYFDYVYTFEPNPDLFYCLVKNVNSKRVVKIPCALSDSHGMVSMEQGDYEGNMGAWWVKPGGQIPALMLDDFDFPYLDLIYLDIEGHEPRALAGAERTVEKHSPVVVVEHKDKILKRCGTEGWLEDWMKAHDYQQVAVTGRDVVMAHV